MIPDAHGRSGGNRLLATLSAEVLERMRPELLESQLGQVVQAADSAVPHVLFPDRGTMLSVVRTDERGGTVEVGVVGAEGASPLHSALASLVTHSEIVVQVRGGIRSIRAEAVRVAFASEEAFRNAALVYGSVYLDQVSQNAVCNRLHDLEERLAKWLLISSRHASTDRLTLTHDFLSHMLGVRRPGVTVAVNTLAMDGLIEHSRGTIAIIDREGLTRRACACDEFLRSSWEEMLDRS